MAALFWWLWEALAELILSGDSTTSWLSSVDFCVIGGRVMRVRRCWMRSILAVRCSPALSPLIFLTREWRVDCVELRKEEATAAPFESRITAAAAEERWWVFVAMCCLWWLCDMITGGRTLVTTGIDARSIDERAELAFERFADAGGDGSTAEASMFSMLIFTRLLFPLVRFSLGWE